MKNKSNLYKLYLSAALLTLAFLALANGNLQKEGEFPQKAVDNSDSG